MVPFFTDCAMLWPYQEEKMTRYITRIAPSPTGDFHFGTARTAYFNWLAARGSDGKFILRIDDTDRERNNEESVDVIFKSMSWLGLDWDETFRQSDRIERYQEVAKGLVQSGKAYLADNGAVLLSPGMNAGWRTFDGTEMVASESAQKLADDQVLIRGDGMPIYHFASVVDDADYGVNLIIRGVDHVTNTFRQAAIFNALGADLPEFSHLGLIMKDKKKMSKRDSAASLLNWMEKGYDPDGVLNTMLRLGWGPSKDDKSTAIIDKQRAVKMFLAEGKMKSSNVSFDEAKMDSFDRKYKAQKEKEIMARLDMSPLTQKQIDRTKELAERYGW